MNALPKRSLTVLLGTVLAPVLFASCEEAPTEGNDPGEIPWALPGAWSPWPGCKDDDDGGDDDGGRGGGDGRVSWENKVDSQWWIPTARTSVS